MPDSIWNTPIPRKKYSHLLKWRSNHILRPMLSSNLPCDGLPVLQMFHDQGFHRPAVRLLFGNTSAPGYLWQSGSIVWELQHCSSQIRSLPTDFGLPNYDNHIGTDQKH